MFVYDFFYEYALVRFYYHSDVGNIATKPQGWIQEEGVNIETEYQQKVSETPLNTTEIKCDCPCKNQPCSHKN